MTARRALLKRVDVTSIEHALRRVQERTTGELRVSVAGYFRGDPSRLAARAFHRLGLDARPSRNGVLILVAPARRAVVVRGDDAIHALVGEAFWQQVTDQLTKALGAGRDNEGLLQAIETLGHELARHFPV